MNKTRRRKKNSTGMVAGNSAKKGEPVVIKVTSPSKIRHGKELIEKHCQDAENRTREAEVLAKQFKYGEAAVKLRSASDCLHLANAEKRRLPADALQ